MRQLADSERSRSAHRLLNRTSNEPEVQGLVHELFAQRAGQHPGAAALRHGEEIVTYGELAAQAGRLATALSAAGVQPGDTVGVWMDRSPDLIAGLIAILSCGAAYLPVDRRWPAGRAAATLRDADCEVLLSDGTDAVTGAFRGRQVRPASAGQASAGQASAGQASSGRASSGRASPGELTGATHPGSIAFVSYTSGSTGQPKGVPVTHRSIANLARNARYARLDDQAVVLQVSPIAFDAATFEIWGALLNGGVCVLHPPGQIRLSSMQRVLGAAGVNVMFLTTALFNAIIDEAPQTLDLVATILTGGEACSLRHMSAALHRYGPNRLVHVYGPTECTTFTTYHRVRRIEPGAVAVPIGTPIQNVRVYLAQHGRLCQPGETGEILIGGAGVCPGYLGRPEETRQRFADYAVLGAHERLYHSGDHGYLAESGDLVFVGRVDRQVKIDGFRIEPDEVSHHIGQYPGVKQNYVTTSDGLGGSMALIAFVVAGEDGCQVAALREFLGARLPAYMVPARVYLCGELPLTGTGKVDGQALISAHPGLSPATGPA
jgi:D-alanine--poly(phosphoribitol) ligase subunit 1